MLLIHLLVHVITVDFASFRRLVLLNAMELPVSSIFAITKLKRNDHRPAQEVITWFIFPNSHALLEHITIAFVLRGAQEIINATVYLYILYLFICT